MITGFMGFPVHFWGVIYGFDLFFVPVVFMRLRVKEILPIYLGPPKGLPLTYAGNANC